MPHQTLPDAIIQQFKDEAATAGDDATVKDCDLALTSSPGDCEYDTAMRRLVRVLAHLVVQS